jgi:hypothetical protein
MRCAPHHADDANVDPRKSHHVRRKLTHASDGTPKERRGRVYVVIGAARPRVKNRRSLMYIGGGLLAVIIVVVVLVLILR